ncbi:hypothetical protein H072_11247 [Dactylellina haptotyla CBS 200.50]|uniref:Uncharacterized protein n=1 Tax=Dactylellina haptotyla (strain CBS 200.50) TaxID=1284197 RepID=S8B8P6_DACHA|nr:hypothetical protein H072_11247 [Dactylellina haptotyla CBS 200.50]
MVSAIFVPVKIHSRDSILLFKCLATELEAHDNADAFWNSITDGLWTEFGIEWEPFTGYNIDSYSSDDEDYSDSDDIEEYPARLTYEELIRQHGDEDEDEDEDDDGDNGERRIIARMQELELQPL